MATKLYCTIGMMLLVASIYCSPIKRSTIEQATDQLTDCYGTDCVVDLDFPTETIIDVAFPENLTQAIMSALPNIEADQNLTVALLENINAALQRHNQQIQNMTSTMAGLFGNVANLLQSQLSVLSERLPPPPPLPSLSLSSPSLSPSLSPPNDCQDIAAQGASVSGSYTITPQDGLGSFTVYCDMDTDGGGWTVFQRRFDGSVDFYRGWDDYEHGFGSPDGEYWLGLQQIHRLTMTGNMVLRIDLEDFGGNTEYAEYEAFQVGDAGTHYQLSIGAYSGNGQDEFIYHNNQAFSTKDRDNDSRAFDNCARHYQGAWWYNSCYHSNLNGRYLGSSGTDTTGMRWTSTSTQKRTEMKMRRVQ